MSTQVAVKEKDIADSVLVRIKSLENQGGLRLPQNYSAENALKSAWLILQETQTATKRPVLEACTKPSIANCLLDMVVQGLNPVKKQCYFIAYGDRLTMARSYMGTVAVAKRYGNIVETRANVIYKDDEFEFDNDALTGDKVITKHKQTLASLNGEIVGAYAILTLDDGRKYVEIMSKAQIEKSWGRGQAKGASMSHKDHPEEMCKKTVISRACKMFINTSDDSALFIADDEFDSRDYSKIEAKESANQGDIIDMSDTVDTSNTQAGDSEIIDEHEALLQETLRAETEAERANNVDAGF